MALVAINPAGQIKKANEVKARSDLTSTRSAIEMYELEKGVYPVRLDDLVPDYMLPGKRMNLVYQILPGGLDFKLCIQDARVEISECVGKDLVPEIKY